MLDLQAIERRANARTTATPANPANRLIEDDDASGGSVSQLATLAGDAAEHAIEQQAGSISQLATLAGVDAAHAVPAADDERVRCGSCSHYVERTRRCGNHRRAGLRSPELGLDLPELLQRCPGFVGRITSTE